MSGGVRPYGGGLETRIAELERKLRSLGAVTGGTIASMGTVSLSTGTTSTTQTDGAVTASSIIFPVASSADGWSIDAGITGITTAAGQFTITHSNSTLSRSFKYIAVNPA